MSKKLSQQQLAIRLVWTSLFLWALSLLLAGYTFKDGNSDKGLYILIFGTLLGWLATSSWTVYSNIFYIIACGMILTGKKPKKTMIFMFPFALWLFVAFFYEYKITVDVGYEKPVASWGWGAILLLFAQSLLVISALLTHKKISVKNTYITIGLLVLPLIGIAILGYSQRNQANDWELKHYFPSYDVAFTKRPLSGLPYKALTEKIPRNAIIEIKFIGDISPIITENENAYPNTYWQNGEVWEQYYTNVLTHISMVKKGNSVPTYRLEISTPKPNYYLYTLYKKDNGMIVYQQPLEKYREFNNHFFPSLYSTIENIGYVGSEKQKELTLWQSEKGQEDCLVKKVETDSLNVIWQLEKHQLRLFGSYDEDRNIVGTNFYANKALCSENYLLAINYDEKSNSIYRVWLFERKTGFPTAKFYHLKKQNSGFDIQKDEIKQFEFVVVKKQENEKNKSHLVLHTDKGDIKFLLELREFDIYR